MIDRSKLVSFVDTREVKQYIFKGKMPIEDWVRPLVTQQIKVVPDLEEYNETSLVHCEHCSDDTGADVAHPWDYFEEGFVGKGSRKVAVNWCKIEWEKYDNCPDYLEE